MGRDHFRCVCVNEFFYIEPKCESRSNFRLFMNYYNIHAFFIGNTFISNARLKLAKNQANAKQQPYAECACVHEIIRSIIMKVKMKIKNRSHRYDVNRQGLDMYADIVNIKSVSV